MSALLSYLASIGVLMGAAYVVLHSFLQPDLAQATTQAARPVPENSDRSIASLMINPKSSKAADADPHASLGYGAAANPGPTGLPPGPIVAMPKRSAARSDVINSPSSRKRPKAAAHRKAYMPRITGIRE